MKHRIHVISLALALCAAPALAQTPEQQGYIKQVRAVYNKAQDSIKQGKAEPQAKNEVTFKATYMQPGAGQTQHTVELFFRTPQVDEDGRTMPAQPYLARESFNVAARKFYREYLWGDAGEPLFFYSRHDTFDKGKVEQRYYYRGGEVAAAVPEGGDGMLHLPQFERMKALLHSVQALQQGGD